MNLPAVSSGRRLRSLAIVIGIAAFSALTGACGDDDDEGVAGSGGQGGTAGKGSAGASAGCGAPRPSGGSGGTGGSSGSVGCGGPPRSGGSGGTGGSSGNGGVGGATDDDAGMTDDAGEEPGPNPDDFRNVTFMMSDLTIEVGEFMQFRLISADGDLITVGVIHGAPVATFPFELPHSAPAGQVVTFEVWADTAGTVDNAYDAMMDHAWTGTIGAGDADEDAVVAIAGGVQASPPTLTQGIAAPGSLGFTMMNTNDHNADLFELRVLDNATGRLVGRQLLPIPGNEIGLEVYGVLHTGVEYQVDYSIDLDGDFVYDAPPDDAAWRQFVTATANGYNSGPGATISLTAVPDADDYVDVGF
jgi:hypothetical protein